MSKNHVPTTAATKVLDGASVQWTPYLYEHDPRNTRFGLETVEVLGLNPAQVFKTLIVQLGSRQGIAVIPVEESLNLKSAAAALAEAGGPKVKTAEMCDENTAQNVTGYVVGGISPLGTKKRLPTVLDQSALGRETIFVSGGRRGFSVEVSPADLVNLTQAVVAPLTR